MYCKNCGKQMPDDHKVCTQCGTKKGEGKGFCSECGAKMPENAIFCTSCGHKAEDPVQTETAKPAKINLGKKNDTQQAAAQTQEQVQAQTQAPAQTQPQPQIQNPTPAPTQPQIQNPAPAPTQPQIQNPAPAVQQNMQMNNAQPAPQGMQNQMMNPVGQNQQQYYQQPVQQPRKVFCRSCGKEMMYGNKICSACGASFGDGNAFCHNCGTQIHQGAAVCTGCGKSTKPPFDFVRYMKDFLSSFTSVIKQPLVDMISHHLPTLLSLIALIVMFFRVITYSRPSIGYTISIYSGYGGNIFRTAALAGVCIILAFLCSIALYEPFTRNLLKKNNALQTVRLVAVPALHLLAICFMVLSLITMSNESQNAYLYIPKYMNVRFTIMGWVLIVILALSAICGVAALVTKGKNLGPVLFNPSARKPVTVPVNTGANQLYQQNAQTAYNQAQPQQPQQQATQPTEQNNNQV